MTVKEKGPLINESQRKVDRQSQQAPGIRLTWARIARSRLSLWVLYGITAGCFKVCDGRYGRPQTRRAGDPDLPWSPAEEGRGLIGWAIH
jgi:hypothetical protein